MAVTNPDLLPRTARVALRPWGRDDAARLKAITSKPAVVRHVAGGLLWSAERTRAFIERQQGHQRTLGYCLWALVVDGDDAPGGYVGLQPLGDTGEVEIGWVLDEPLWGRGLATEAARAAMRYGFEIAGLPRIVAIAVPDNRASINVMRKLGMTYERDLCWKGFDVVMYGRARPQRAVGGSAVRSPAPPRP